MTPRSVRSVVLAALACAACAAPPNGLDSLVATQPAPASACPNGGIEVDSGLDANRDGSLEPSEIANRQDVCAPPAAAPSAPQLVRVVDEPAGASCAGGGVAVESGLDENGNGVLDDGEVTSTTFVCAGADGSAGSDSASGDILVRIVSEPPGAHCAAGGEAVKVGIDANADGSLEDSEVEDVAFVCRAAAGGSLVIDGDYTVTNDLDLAGLAGVTDITGTLRFDATVGLAVSLPELQHCGAVHIIGVGLLDTSLPSLESVDGILDLHAVATLDLSSLRSASSVQLGGPETISLPAFETGEILLESTAVKAFSTGMTSGTLVVTGASALATVELDQLATGTVEVLDSPGVVRVDLPALTAGSISLGSTGSVAIGAPNLTSVSIPNLVSGFVFVGDAPLLATVDIPSLHDGGGVRLFQTGLPVLALPALVSADLVNVIGNPQLTSIDAPNLTSLARLDIETDPKLPTCLATALATQSHATTVTITGTDATATCP